MKTDGVSVAREVRVKKSAMGLLRAVPILGVFAALGGIAWWGHHTGWTLPKFSDLLGGSGTAPTAWCDSHGVTEEDCVECNPGLLPRPKTYGWCREHGVHECPLEHPDVAEMTVTPKVAPEDVARAARALQASERPTNNQACKLHLRRLQFGDVEAVNRAGIDVRPVGTGPVVESVAVSGEVGYDQTRIAHLSSVTPGSVWRVSKHLGDEVKRGDVLALVNSPEVGKAKAELLQAVVQARLRAQTHESLRAIGSTPEPTIRQAEAAAREASIRVATARQALTNLGLTVRPEDTDGLNDEQLAQKVRFLGLPDDVVKTLDPRTPTTNLVPLTAPMDGVVVSREVVAGEVVDTNRILFEVVDVRQMWLTLDVRGEDASKVRRGQVVKFRPDGDRAEVSGTINWISTQADPKTRTIKVRADLANADSRLRANTFGSGRVILREETAAVVVPSDAVHWEGDCHIVFVRDKNYLTSKYKVFHTRTVRPGVRDNGQTEIIAGLLPGEVIATKGGGVLRAELLRAKLGEG